MEGNDQQRDELISQIKQSFNKIKLENIITNSSAWKFIEHFYKDYELFSIAYTDLFIQFFKKSSTTQNPQQWGLNFNKYQNLTQRIFKNLYQDEMQLMQKKDIRKRSFFFNQFIGGLSQFMIGFTKTKIAVSTKIILSLLKVTDAHNLKQLLSIQTLNSLLSNIKMILINSPINTQKCAVFIIWQLQKAGTLKKQNQIEDLLYQIIDQNKNESLTEFVIDNMEISNENIEDVFEVLWKKNNTARIGLLKRINKVRKGCSMQYSSLLSQKQQSKNKNEQWNYSWKIIGDVLHYGVGNKDPKLDQESFNFFLLFFESSNFITINQNQSIARKRMKGNLNTLKNSNWTFLSCFKSTNKSQNKNKKIQSRNTIEQIQFLDQQAKKLNLTLVINKEKLIKFCSLFDKVDLYDNHKIYKSFNKLLARIFFCIPTSQIKYCLQQISNQIKSLSQKEEDEVRQKDSNFFCYMLFFKIIFSISEFGHLDEMQQEGGQNIKKLIPIQKFSYFPEQMEAIRILKKVIKLRDIESSYEVFQYLESLAAGKFQLDYRRSIFAKLSGALQIIQTLLQQDEIDFKGYLKKQIQEFKNGLSNQQSQEELIQKEKRDFLTIIQMHKNLQIRSFYDIVRVFCLKMRRLSRQQFLSQLNYLIN